MRFKDLLSILASFMSNVLFIYIYLKVKYVIAGTGTKKKLNSY